MTTIVDRLAAAVRAHDARAVAGCFAPGGVIDVPTHGLRWVGRDQVQRAASMVFGAFGDLAWQPRARWLDAAATVEEGTWSGSQDGPLGDWPATGRRAEVRARVWIDHDDVAVHRIRIYSDPTALKLALGMAVSTLEEAGDTSRLAVTGGRDRARVFVRPAAAASARPRRRRRRRVGRLLAVLVMTAGIMAAGVVTAGVIRDSRTSPTAASPASSPTATPTPSAGPAAPSRSDAGARTATPKSGVTRRGRNLDLSTDVLFDQDSSVLTARARTAIGEVAGVLRDLKASGRVRVNGYTDDEGSAGYNLALSRARAEAVTAALSSRYRGELTLVATGFGEADPVASNGTAPGQARNRRVTIVLPKP